MRNHYELLKVEQGVFSFQIQRAYDKLMVQKRRDPNERNQTYYNHVDAAYNVLINSTNRKKYNINLELERHTKPIILVSARKLNTDAMLNKTLSEFLQAYPENAVLIWKDAKRRLEIDQWEWTELAMNNEELANEICASDTLTTWSNHNIFMLANMHPSNGKKILANPPVANLLTGTELHRLAKKYKNAIIPQIRANTTLNLKFNAANILEQHADSLYLADNEAIEPINANYILGKFHLHIKRNLLAAIEHLKTASSNLHLPSIKELIGLGNIEDLKFGLDLCERMDENSLDYHIIKSLILKSILKITAPEPKRTFIAPANKLADENWLSYELLNVSPSATLDEIKNAYDEIQTRGLRDTNERNETYYTQVIKAYNILTKNKLSAQDNVFDILFKNNADNSYMQEMTNNKGLAVTRWNTSRSRLLQWQWYELAVSNPALTQEICASKSISSWCNYIIFKLAATNSNNCETVILSSAAIVLTGTELCQLVEMYPGIKTQIEDHPTLSLKYYAANILRNSDYKQLNLAKSEQVEVINPHYIIAKKLLHANVTNAAIYYLKLAIKAGHINSYYELINIGGEANLKYCLDLCNTTVDRNSSDYRYIREAVQHTLPVSVDGIPSTYHQVACIGIQDFAKSRELLFNKKGTVVDAAELAAKSDSEKENEYGNANLQHETPRFTSTLR